MMQKAIIIDDEAKGRLALKEKLKQYCPEVEVVAEASNGKEGIAAINIHHPQVIFLDIEMPVMNGFEMLNNLSEKNFHIIFTTAYDQYAIKAIKYAAFDYLLKPIDIEELKTAVYNYYGGGTNGEKLKIFIQHLSYGLGNYLESVSKQSSNGSDPFTEPTLLHSNIEKGIGAFGGYSVSDTVYLQL